MRKKAIWLLYPLLCLLLALSVGGPAYAEGPLPTPHSFYGTVTIDGLPALPGTTIEAIGPGVITGPGNPITTTVEGQYGSADPLETTRLVVQGYIDEGAPITFLVNGVPANETAYFHSGTTADELNLTVGEEPAQYSLTVASSDGGSVTTPGEDTFTYDPGAEVPLLAEPTEGYQFLNWTGDVSTVDDVNEPSTTITMNGDYSVMANFALIGVTYNLTVASSDGGSVTTPGEDTFTYDPGAEVPLLAEPTEGYQFVNWTGDVGDIADINAALTTITMNGDYSITANFALIGVTYTLTIIQNPVVGGTVITLEPPQPVGGYEANTSVELTATPAEGYAFGSWSGDLTGSTNPDTITMDSDKSIVANFVEFSVPENVSITEMDPGVESVTVTTEAVEELDVTQMPGIDPQEAYLVEPTGTGNFTLRFTGVSNASEIRVYKVVDSTWTLLEVTVVDATTIEVTMEVADPILVFALPLAPVATFTLSAGWNIISTPIALHASMDTWEEASAELDIDPLATTYYFDSSNQIWGQVLADYQLKPCDAIYVKMALEDTVNIIANSLPSVPSKRLYAGWNLVGLAYLPMAEGDLPGMKANEALISVEEVTGGLTGYVLVVSPPVNQPPWIYTGGDINDWVGESPPDGWMLVDRGYWVFMLNDGTLAGFTFTPLGW